MLSTETMTTKREEKKRREGRMRMGEREWKEEMRGEGNYCAFD